MMGRVLGAALLVILPSGPLLAQTAAPDEACGGVVFRDVAVEAGVDFVHGNGAAGEFHEPETFGAGVVWLDYDGDSLLDLYLVQSGTFPPAGTVDAANRLFRNLGQGRFVDVTDSAGVGDRGYGQGAVAADVDGDGHIDLYVTNFGPDALYRNRGNGTFDNVTVAAGLGVDGWSSSAAFADADLDGDLDLYVARYLQYDIADKPLCLHEATGARDYCHPQLFLAQDDRFYRNRGDGTFQEATAAAGLAVPDGKGLGVVFTDLDDDGSPDLYVANDTTPNFVFRNRGDGTFEEVGLLSGAAVSRDGKAQAGMGVGLGDIDADGLPDLAVSNFDTETNALYRNQGVMSFHEISAASGFGLPSFNLLGFGIVLADLDGDADVDAYVANGHVLQVPSREGVGYAQPDLLLLGDGNSGFAAAMCGAALQQEYVSRGLAVADFDDDGDLDIAVANNSGPLRLLRNESPQRDWIGFVLAGPGGNSGAIGARVMIEGLAGQPAQWVLAGDSFLSSRDPRLLFALPGSARPTAIMVRWPSGATTRVPFREDLVGRYTRIDEPISPGS